MQPFKINTISQFHQFRGLPKPQHPLISVLKFEDIKSLHQDEPLSLVNGFYAIALKRDFEGKMKYGQQAYDFDEGIMVFISPGQIFSIESGQDIHHSGWMILVHPDYLLNTPLAKK